MLVKNIMTNTPITVPESTDYKSTFAIMEEHKIHHLPIMNKNDDIVGLVALSDLKMAARCFREAPVEISEVMHTPVLTANVNDTLANAIKLMIDKRFGCLPIVDDKNKIVGMLTETDLFQTLLSQLANLRTNQGDSE